MVYYFFFFVIIGFIVMLVTIIHLLRKHRLLKEFEQKEENIHDQLNIFSSDYLDIQKQYISKSTENQFVEKWKGLHSEISKYDLPKRHHSFEEIAHFKNIFNSLREYFATANEHFIQSESEKYDYLFSNIDGKSLDEQQRTAVITDEDRILVLAGAGSGKTLTIAAKVKYLCEIKKVKP
ncbi:MAG: UvrD-helicase domain-containing protein, partial [Bacteroidales bacterium]|nr:UvrD-helicase domain-containing protein [Bacteroidales bacterium]